ncbi:radical SAM protein [Chloroflexota bacterium]
MAIPDLVDCDIELGPIRPPNEAYSLLVRVTRNCSWNRCEFCNIYKGQKFELRKPEEVIDDIKKAKTVCDEIKNMAGENGYGDRLRELAATLYNQYILNSTVRNVALWIWAGQKSAFLQDANTLIMRTPDLVQVITFLKQIFPKLDRITSYARSKTALKKTVEELRELSQAGLSRLHIGLESGSDLVLSYMQKGVTAEEHVIGGKKVKEAGISLSEYIMPGLGGRKMSLDHVRGTADVLNQIDPDFIRIRSLFVNQGMPLWEKVESGDFEVQTEDEVVEELGGLIEKLEVNSEVKSDHIMNLLPDIEGKFPEAKAKCLDIIHKYLSLPEQERLNYKLGRRAGYYEHLDDLNDNSKYEKIEEAIKTLNSETSEGFEVVMQQLKRKYWI